MSLLHTNRRCQGYCVLWPLAGLLFLLWVRGQRDDEPWIRPVLYVVSNEPVESEREVYDWSRESETA